MGIRVHTDTPINQLDPDYDAPVWYHTIQTYLTEMQVTPIPLDRFLDKQRRDLIDVEEADDDSAPTTTTGPKKDKEQKKAKQDGDKFKIDHFQRYQEADLEWPPKFSRSFTKKTRLLTVRAQEIVHYMEKVHGLPGIGESERVFDAHMSIEWGSMPDGVVPCIASTSRMWALRGGFTLDGLTCLELQGFPRSAVIPPRGRPAWTTSELINLAGNAFNAGVAIAVLLVMSLAPIGEHERGCGDDEHINDAVGSVVRTEGDAGSMTVDDGDLDLEMFDFLND